MKYVCTHETFYPNISRETVWEIMTDINNWKDWHPVIDDCRLEGAFEVGNSFTLTPRGKKPVTITLVDIKKGYEFTDRTDFPGAQMFDTHTLTETEDGVTIGNRLEMKGPLRWVWMWLVGSNVASTMPHKMDLLAALAGKRDGIRLK